MECNVGKADKIVRVIVAIVLLWFGYTLKTALFKWLLYIIAVILIITVITGKCIPYKWMGVNTCKSKASSVKTAQAKPAAKKTAKKKK